MKNKKICVVGLGYIGLPTAAIIASQGIKVLGVDVNRETVNMINQGQSHIAEKDLENLVSLTVKQGYLSASTCVQEADFFFVAVPTPINPDHSPDLNYVKAAISSIAPFLKKGNAIIIESTCPVGTTKNMASLILELRKDFVLGDVHLSYCPERVLPGRIVHELTHNNRIVGGLTQACAHKAQEIYKTFVCGKIELTNSKTAEMVKLTENAFRDLNIAFANEISMLSYESEIDILDVIQFANQHPRVNILNPGIGVGGHCIAIDPWFLVHQSPSMAQIIKKAREVNTQKTQWVFEKLLEKLQTFTNPRIGLLGLSFKENIDDFRESPAIDIAKKLSDFYNITVVDPYMEKKINMLSNCNLKNLSEALESCNILILLVKHELFNKIKINHSQILIDATNLR